MLHCTFWLVLTGGTALRNCHLTSGEVATTLPSFRIVEQESVRLKKKTKFFFKFFFIELFSFFAKEIETQLKVQFVKILRNPGILTAMVQDGS